MKNEEEDEGDDGEKDGEDGEYDGEEQEKKTKKILFVKWKIQNLFAKFESKTK